MWELVAGGGGGWEWNTVIRSFRAVNCMDMVWGRGRGRLQVLQTIVAIVLGSENNSYTGELHLHL